MRQARTLRHQRNRQRRLLEVRPWVETLEDRTAPSISGMKFHDLNGDAVRQTGEPALSGWTTYLDINANGRLDGGEPSRVTDASGGYQFSGLAAGSYLVREVVEPGWIQTAPAAGFHSATIIDASTVVSGRDFGNFRAATVSGVKFQDFNGNGTRDAGEPGLSGWTVYQDVNNDGRLDQTVVTLEADDYPTGTVLDRVLPEVTLSARGGGSILAIASSVPAAGARFFGTTSSAFSVGLEMRIDFNLPTSSVTLDAISHGSFGYRGLLRAFNAAGQEIATATTAVLAASQIAPVTLSRTSPDIAFVLASSDSSSSGLSLDNLRVNLFGTEPATVTGADGSYTLAGFRPGMHVVREVLQPNWQQTAPASGFHSISIMTSGQTITGRDFGNRSGTIGGQVFRDTNGNGTRDTGEPSLTGWTVYLDLNDNGQRDAGEPNRISDGQGNYRFTGLASGPYAVREAVQGGWTISTPSAGVHRVTIVDASTVAGDRDFGNFQQGTIRGVKFQDLNSDGTRDGGEPGLPGWTIYNDVNNNGQLDRSPVTRILEADDYPAGTDLSRVLPEVLVSRGGSPIVAFTNPYPVGGARVIGTPSSAYSVGLELRIDFSVPAMVVSLDAISAGSFGYRGVLRAFDAGGRELGRGTTEVLGTGQLGTMTVSRPAPDIAFALAGSDSSIFGLWVDNLRATLLGGEPFIVTGTNGAYILPGIGPGSQRIRELGQPNWEPTAPPAGVHTVMLTSGQDLSGIDFGNRSGTITGTKYRDTNGSGVRDAGEPGLSGWTVYLDLDGDGVRDTGEPSQVTDTQGNYAFRGLAAGTYLVREVLQAGWLQTAPGEGFHTAEILDAATVISGLDIGNFQLVTVSGVKFHDFNGDGVRQAGEPGLAGWTIFDDRNDSGAPDEGDAIVVTGTGGSYALTGVGPGLHRIREVLLSGWAVITPLGGVHEFAAVSGVNQTNRDFGNRRVVTALDLVDDQDPEFDVTGPGWSLVAGGYRGGQRSHDSSATPGPLTPNGGFESATLAPWTAAGGSGNPTPVTGLGTILPPAGSRMAFLNTSPGAVGAAAMQTFLGLDASLDPLGGGTVIEGRAIRQTITAAAGDRLTFLWNFLTSEATPSPFNDFAFVSLMPAGGGDPLLLATLADTRYNGGQFLPGTGGFLGQTGFQLFSFDIPIAGTFILGLGVADVGSADINSGLLVDEVRLGPAVEESFAVWSTEPGKGIHELFVTWTAAPSRATEARYLIYDGATLLGRTVVNQRLAPSSAQLDGVLWQSLGMFRSTSGQLTVKLSDFADGGVAADAVLVGELVQAVSLDVKPGEFPNEINLSSNGVLPVSVLTTAAFDATSIDTSDLSCIVFGDAEVGARVSPLRTALQDVDGDGDLDLLLHFSMRQLREAGALLPGSTRVELTALTRAGQRVRGGDSVRMVPGPAPALPAAGGDMDAGPESEGDGRTDGGGASSLGKGPGTQDWFWADPALSLPDLFERPAR